jgi:hypothetical protein
MQTRRYFLYRVFEIECVMSLTSSELVHAMGAAIITLDKLIIMLIGHL